jgi:enoyl-CoA hydratase
MVDDTGSGTGTTGGADAVREERDGEVSVIHLDDGKVNALSHAVVERLAELLRGAEDAGAIVLVGRRGLFSAGFDLRTMQEGPDAARRLVAAGAELLLQVYAHPRPVVAACTGHALAGGALLLLTADTRVGAEGAFRIGLNETAIGMPLPPFALALAEDRLSRRHLTRATVQATIYDPTDAVDAGYLDRVVDPANVVAEAVGEARRLSELDAAAYRATKSALRGPLVERVQAAS